MRPQAIVEAAEHALALANGLNGGPTQLADVLVAFGLVGPFDFADHRLGRRAVRRGKALRSRLHGLTVDGRVILDQSLPKLTQRFVIGHEIAHAAGLPWHGKVFDAGLNVSALVNSGLEREADQFAEELLFKGDRFHLELAKKPLDLMVPIRAAPEWEVPVVRSIRRYVETHEEPIAAFSAPINLQAMQDSEVLVRAAWQSRAFRALTGPLSNWLPCPLGFGYGSSLVDDREWLRDLVRYRVELLSDEYVEHTTTGRCEFKKQAPGMRFSYQGVVLANPRSVNPLSSDVLVVLLEVE